MRYLNADGQINEGILGANMFAYCENDPVNYDDPTGEAPGDKFSSADAAAKDFAWYYYAITGFYRIEVGSVIYSVRAGDRMYYSYTPAVIGGPHSVSIPLSIPAGRIVATIHTHPNGNSFSSTDKNSAKKFGILSYVATPNKKLLKYDPNTKKTTTIAKNMKYRHLTRFEMNKYERTLSSIWYDHLPDKDHKGWGCPKKSWIRWDWR